METAAAQMNIFFLVTTLVVVAVGVLAIVFLVYAISFLRDVRMITQAIRDELTEIVDDIDEFRKDLKGKADKFSGLLGIITSVSFIRKFLRD